MRFCWVIFFSFVIQLTVAQVKDYEFFPVTTAMGLPHKTVTAILQDSDGFIWFATLDGICRYDGYAFKVFQREPSDSNSLSHNRVLCMALDKKGNIWLGTEGAGACKFDPVTEKFQQYAFSKDEKTICGPEILSVKEDHKGNMWFGSRNNGACMLDVQTQQFTIYQYNKEDSLNSIGPGSVWNVFEDSDGKIWFSTWGIGFSVLDPQNGQFEYVTTSTEPGIHSIYSGVIHEDKHKKLWMTNWGGGLDVYDLTTKKITNHRHKEHQDSIISDETWAISHDKNGDIWVGSYNGGLSRFDIKKKTFENFTPHNSGLTHESTWSLMIDKSGVVWVGHDGGDVTMIIRNEKEFQHYTHDANDTSSLGLALVRCLFQDSRGRIWAGDWAGNMNLMNQEKGVFEKYKWPEERRKDKISCIYEITQDLFLVGTYRGGLNYFDANQKKFGRQYTPDDSAEKAISHLYVFDIAEDKEGNIWVGTAKGLNLFHPEKGTFDHYFHDKSNPETISNDEIKTLFLDAKGGFWIGTENGLNKKEGNKFKRYFRVQDHSNSLPHSTVTAICETPKGRLWVGTRNGIARYNPSTDDFTSYEISIKAKKNDVKSMLADNLGNIWISTADGLVKFVIATQQFIYYDSEKEGIQGTDFEQGSCLKTEEGKLYFGGTNGFNCFHPRDIKDNTYIPPIVFTDFKVNNKAFKLKKAVHKTPLVELNFRENNISFGFAALNFVIPEKNRYRYKLEGFDEEWIDAGTKNYADYTNLDPGEYTFRVVGSNNDKLWNNKGTSIKLTINPPFWQTTGFYVFQSLFFVTLLGFSIYFNRSNKHNRIAKTLAFLSLFMIFEYIFVLLEPTVDEFSQGAAFFKVMMNLVLALTMIPVEKLVEKQYTKKPSKLA